MDFPDHIRPEDIPGLDLYADQVTTFMEQQLSLSKRREEDKILTKTMINNYAKNDLLPPPEKKKYSKEHILMLILIYYYKNIMSINDIKTLLDPLRNQYFHSGAGISLEDIYKELFSFEEQQLQQLEKDTAEMASAAGETFSHIPSPERDKLQRFAFLSFLSFDVYLKKQMIESIVDEMAAEQAEEKENISRKKK